VRSGNVGASPPLFPVMSAKRFRVAFSFAGEKRDFVASVASSERILLN
jgi:hypothetical protein